MHKWESEYICHWLKNILVLCSVPTNVNCLDHKNSCLALAACKHFAHSLALGPFWHPAENPSTLRQSPPVSIEFICLLLPLTGVCIYYPPGVSRGKIWSLRTGKKQCNFILWNFKPQFAWEVIVWYTKAVDFDIRVINQKKVVSKKNRFGKIPILRVLLFCHKCKILYCLTKKVLRGYKQGVKLLKNWDSETPFHFYQIFLRIQEFLMSQGFTTWNQVGKDQIRVYSHVGDNILLRLNQI